MRLSPRCQRSQQERIAMAIEAAYVFRKGEHPKDVTIDALRHNAGNGEFVWVGLTVPDDSELRSLKSIFDLHPLAIEDALSGKQVSKFDIYGDQLFVVVKTAHLEGDRIIHGEISIFVGKGHLITVRHRSAKQHDPLSEHLNKLPQLLAARGTDYLLHAIIDFVVDGYLPMVATIEDRVLELETHILAAFLEPDQIRRIFRMRRQVIKFQRMLGPMEVVVGKLSHLDLPCIGETTKPFFKDVHDHVRRTDSLLAGLRDVITSVFEASNLLEQQRQGAITRQLAAWAAILAIPTAVAGIYGMNFRNMPELDTRFGYFVTLGAMASVCSILYVRFRKIGWL